jgi:hypothetical protein
VRPGQWLRVVDRFGLVIVLAVEWRKIAGLHLLRDLKRFLQLLEPIIDRREGQTKPDRLALEPTGAEVGPFRDAHQVIERAVAFQHWIADRADGRDLKKMIQLARHPSCRARLAVG